MNYINSYLSPLGPITMSSDGTALTGLWFDGQKYFGGTIIKEAPESKVLPVFEHTRTWLDLYFNGNHPDFIPQVKLTGSLFRLSVWKITSGYSLRPDNDLCSNCKNYCSSAWP